MAVAGSELERYIDDSREEGNAGRWQQERDVEEGLNAARTSGTSDLSVRIGRLQLPNPILVASGTFGYAREMEPFVDLNRLGGIVPKTITWHARPGNRPWRTVETSAGLLNSIGLDNDGIDEFCRRHLPYLRELRAPIIVSIAGSDYDQFVRMAARLSSESGIAAIELNISCPNVSGGVDFGTDPAMCCRLVTGARGVTDQPILAKLTPNVTRIAEVAQGAADGGADGVTLINTVLGMAVNWRTRRPLLGNGLGGLSGPAIKPIALRCVHQVRRAVSIPIIGVGGIATIDDVMQFLVTGASAVQIGTANFYDPTLSQRLIDELPAALAALQAHGVAEIVGTLTMPTK